MFDKLFVKNDYKIDWKFVETISEFARLKECEQSPKWHGEGDAWKHTVACVNAAYTAILDERYEGLDPMVAIAAVLFHDIGKGVTTKFLKGAWHSYGHEFESEKIARRILWNEPLSIREIICACAHYHMKVLDLANSKKDIVREMINISRLTFVNWRYLLFVKHCDILGSKPEDGHQTCSDIGKIEALYEIAHSLGILDGKFCLNRTLSDKMVFRPLCGKEAKSDVMVMIGLPGAGKNTWAATVKDAVMISRDDIRAELGYCNDGDKVVLTGEEEDEVTKVFNERLVNAVKSGKDVIINNLNIKKKYRDAFKTLLSGYAVRWLYLYVEAPTIEENIRRRPTFNPDVIKNMTSVLEWPQPDEYDDLWISKQ